MNTTPICLFFLSDASSALQPGAEPGRMERIAACRKRDRPSRAIRPNWKENDAGERLVLCQPLFFSQSKKNP